MSRPGRDLAERPRQLSYQQPLPTRFRPGFPFKQIRLFFQLHLSPTTVTVVLTICLSQMLQTLGSTFVAIKSWLRLKMSEASDHGQDWLLGKVLSWPDAPAVNKVDTHHHFVPEFYSKGMSPRVLET